MNPLKAFLSGWKAQGKTPTVNPRIPQKYVYAVIDILENEKSRNGLRKIVCDSEESASYFNFSYDALPFSMALTLAGVKSGNDKSLHMALAGGLDALVDSMLDGRLTTPREVIADREERLFIHSLKRRMGYTPPFSHFENEVIEMNSLFSAIYSHRSLGIMDAAMKAFSGGSAGEKAFTEFGIRYASTFLKNATMLPDENKLRYAALYISSVYIILGEIKH